MQSSCTHVCQCGGTTAQPRSTVQAHQDALNSAAQGEWIWSTSDGFAATTSDLAYALAPENDNFLGLSANWDPTTTTITHAQGQMAGMGPKRDDAGSATVSWLPQNETADGLWGASAFVDADLLPAGMAIDLDLNIPGLAHLGCAYDSTATPVERQDSLPTPGLTHSPASTRTYEPLPAVGGFSTAHTASSVGSTPSVPATPTNAALIEADSAPSFVVEQKQAGYHEMPASAPVAHGLASAFDFTNFPQTSTTPVHAQDYASIPTQPSSGASGCVCSASLMRTSTSTSHMAPATQVPIPAPGWLDPESVPVLTPIEPYPSTVAPPRAGLFEYSEWPDAGTGEWTAPATCPISMRYEPYRNPSVASTASSSSQNLFAEAGGSRRRSLTVGSLPKSVSCVADRVRMLGACRAPSPGVQAPASPRLSATKKFSSMPCRRMRAPTATVFPSEAMEATSLVDRRMASLSARSRSNTPNRALAGLFAREALFIETAQSSPALSDLSLGLNTPTSSTFSPPCTPTLGSIGAKPSDSEGDEGRVKIAMHHHRTKLQRAVLNEVVTSLQSAYKHCRRQYSLDGASELVGELHALQLHDHEGYSDASSASLVVAGETREMRKNRQKAESKMRMRRKEIQQFAALVQFAQLAAAQSTPEVVARSLIEVFGEHRDSWITLIALEKRLFHTVRDKLGLGELVVKKLLEQCPPPSTDAMMAV